MTELLSPAIERDLQPDRSDLTDAMSLDPQAGSTYRSKPVWDLTTIETNLNRTGWDWYTNNYGELGDGVLNYGFWNNFRELANSYYLNEAGDAGSSEVNINTFSAFSTVQRTLGREGIALWNDLIKISFQETNAPTSDITFGNTDTGGAQAYAYLPFGDIFDDSAEEDTGSPWEIGRLSGDVWIDGFVASNFSPTDDSYYAKLTVVHELGHALGLSHPGDYDALEGNEPITYANSAKYAQDSLQYSVMSYFDAYETGAQHIDWSLLNFGYAATPLIHDIATIQEIYGADMTTRTGNTVYGFNSTADRAEYNFALNTRPIVAIWDAGGNDTLDFSGWDSPSTIDLNEGAFSSGGGIEDFLTLEQVNANRKALGFAPRSQAAFEFYQSLKAELGLESPLFTDNISIAYGAVIENAVGGGGNDHLIGNSVNNTLTGNGGADLFELRTGGKTGVDRVTDFSRSDVLAVTKVIADSNNDGLITWKAGKALTLDASDGDQVLLAGVTATKGLRYLGSTDGLFYYGDASVRPGASSGQQVYESKVGNDMLNGSTSRTATDIFFFDTANATPGQGADQVYFTNRDLLVTTTRLADNNNDNRIIFGDSVLELSGNGGAVTLHNGGSAIGTLEYDGNIVRGGVTYYVYSTVGSSVGVPDIHF